MKKLLILSGKGGTGKTTVATAFSRLTNAKAIADCDVDAPNLHLVISQKGEGVQTDFYGSEKARVAIEKCTVCGKCMEHCRFDAVKIQNKQVQIDEIRCEGCGVCAYVCPTKAIELYQDIAGKKELYRGESVFSTARLKMGRGNSGKLVTEVKQTLYKEAKEAKLAIIDGSPGIGCPVIASVNGVDFVLIVAEPSLSGLSDLKRLFKTIKTLGSKVAVCINKWDVSKEKTEKMIAFCKENQIPMVGTIPYDATASKAINEHKSIIEIDSEAKKAIIIIYNKVMQLME